MKLLGVDRYRAACQFAAHVAVKTSITTMIKFLSCNLQSAAYNMQLIRDPITSAIKLTSCKEMGGATSHACQSGACSVNKWLIPSIGRYAVIGCKLQVPV